MTLYAKGDPRQKRFRFKDWQFKHCCCSADGTISHSDDIVAFIYLTGDASRKNPFPVCSNHVGLYRACAWRYVIEEVY